MNQNLKVGNEYLKIKILSISTSALIMLLSNTAMASSETTGTPVTNIDDINAPTQIVQQIDDNNEENVEELSEPQETNEDNNINDLLDTVEINVDDNTNLDENSDSLRRC